VNHLVLHLSYQAAHATHVRPQKLHLQPVLLEDLARLQDSVLRTLGALDEAAQLLRLKMAL